MIADKRVDSQVSFKGYGVSKLMKIHGSLYRGAFYFLRALEFSLASYLAFDGVDTEPELDEFLPHLTSTVCQPLSPMLLPPPPNTVLTLTQQVMILFLQEMKMTEFTCCFLERTAVIQKHDMKVMMCHHYQN